LFFLVISQAVQMSFSIEVMAQLIWNNFAFATPTEPSGECFSVRGQ